MASTLETNTITAIEAEAVADVALLNTFGSAQGPNFNVVLTAITALIPTLNSSARRAQVQSIHDGLVNLQGQFNTMVSQATNAETSPPAI